ncbi:6942_t:CDS:2 [Entrophospora sp. SA101]|nr:6942_t:CDS:2 [Entrophospora sp. SA101]
MELNGPTTKRDKINDNLLFSCCCAKVDRTWSGVCDCHRGNYNCDIDCLQESVDKESDESLYYKVVLNLFDNMASEFQDSKVWLIGHSLGGSLASLLGLTHGLPVVAYEAPGERRAAKKLHLPGPPAVPYELLPIWHIGQTADPIYMGLCNGITSWCYLGGYAMETKCHVGKACVFDVVEKLKWGVRYSRKARIYKKHNNSKISCFQITTANISPKLLAASRSVSASYSIMSTISTLKEEINTWSSSTPSDKISNSIIPLTTINVEDEIHRTAIKIFQQSIDLLINLSNNDDEDYLHIY